MKTKLIFLPPAWTKHSDKYYISFHKNKINKYSGLRPLKTGPNLTKQQNSEFLINATFEVRKLDKLDRIQLKTKATHEIISQGLHNTVVGVSPYCVRLNKFQEFYINWYQKTYIIQSLDFKKTVLTGFIGAILGTLVTLTFQKKPTTNKTPNIPTKQSTNKLIDQTTDQTSDKSLKIIDSTAKP